MSSRISCVLHGVKVGRFFVGISVATIALLALFFISAACSNSSSSPSSSGSSGSSSGGDTTTGTGPSHEVPEVPEVPVGQGGDTVTDEDEDTEVLIDSRTAEINRFIETSSVFLEDFRNLKFTSKVTTSVLTLAEIQQNVSLSLEMDAETMAAEFEVLRELHRLLGIIKGDQTYFNVLEELYSGAVVGYYDSEEKTLFSSDTGTILVHELHHALQDQNFDIGALLDNAGSTDAENALRALVEGDAEIVSGSFNARYSDPAPAFDFLNSVPIYSVFGVNYAPSEFGAIPSLLINFLNFSYLDGTLFAAKLNDFSGIDEAFRNPPLSTEQILHPEKYPLELPINVASATYSTWEVKKDDVLGELWLRLWLAQLNGDWADINATNGWGGDRVEILNKKGASTDAGGQSTDWALRWEVQWDEPQKDEKEFREALLLALENSEVFSADGSTCGWQSEYGSIGVFVKDSNVTEIIAARDCATIVSIQGELLSQNP